MTVVLQPSSIWSQVGTILLIEASGNRWVYRRASCSALTDQEVSAATLLPAARQLLLPLQRHVWRVSGRLMPISDTRIMIDAAATRHIATSSRLCRPQQRPPTCSSHTPGPPPAAASAPNRRPATHAHSVLLIRLFLCCAYAFLLTAAACGYPAWPGVERSGYVSADGMAWAALNLCVHGWVRRGAALP